MGDKDGILQFTYSGTSCQNDVQKKFCPQEIQTDTYDNILISDCENNTVTLLDRNGKFLKHLLTTEDGLNRPIGLSMDESGTLWICNDGGKKIVLVRYLE